MTILETNELNWEQTLFSIIVHAGNARSLAKEATELAAEGKFEEADAKLVEANDEQVKAHEVEAKVIRMEAQGEQVPFSVLMVHSLDLLLLSWAEIDNTEQFIELYRRIDALSSGKP
jgi:PTS system cellobiose-specific IIA component